MYICLCNCLKETHIHCAQNSGASSVSDTFRRLGCQPQCGKCVPYIRQSLLSEGAVSSSAG